MENAGVIKKLDDPREWLNSLITVERPDGTLSLCLDLRDLKCGQERERISSYQHLMTSPPDLQGFPTLHS